MKTDDFLIKGYSTFMKIPNCNFENKKISGKIEDIFDSITPQLHNNSNLDHYFVEHFHCSYIYQYSIKPNVSKIYKKLSDIGNREDTIFTNEIMKSGYKLYLDNTENSYYLRINTDGTRDNKTYKEMYEYDDKILEQYINDLQQKN